MIEIKNLTKKFDSNVALQFLDWQVVMEVERVRY